MPTQNTRAGLQTEINSNFPDNTTGLITPANARTTYTDMVWSEQMINATTVGNVDYTIVAGDRLVLTSVAFTAPHTWTLPLANALNEGELLYIADADGLLSSTNTLSVVPAAGNTIGGSVTPVVLTGSGQALLLATNGTTNWVVLAPPISVAGKVLIDDVDAAAQRTTLGLGTVATHAAIELVPTGGATGQVLAKNSATNYDTGWVAGGGGGGAPTDAEYITSTVNATLTAERVLTNTATITWDFTVPGQAKANTAAGGGNVSNVGTPTNNQLAQWTTATTIQGIDISSLGFAPLASPVFTGNPQAPTAAPGDSDTSVATTAFVAGIFSQPHTWSKTQAPTAAALTSAVAADFSTNQLWTATVSGATFTIANPSVAPLPNATMQILVGFATANTIAFGTKFKGLAGYAPSASAGVNDMLWFFYSLSADQYWMIGSRTGISA